MAFLVFWSNRLNSFFSLPQLFINKSFVFKGIGRQITQNSTSLKKIWEKDNHVWHRLWKNEGNRLETFGEKRKRKFTFLFLCKTNLWQIFTSDVIFSVILLRKKKPRYTENLHKLDLGITNLFAKKNKNFDWRVFEKPLFPWQHPWLIPS